MDHDHNTATLLLLDLPESALCGIDLISFKSSPRFRGIKHIPKGWHFIFIGVSEAVSIRHGSWFHVSGANSDDLSQMFVLKYDPEREDLVAEEQETVKLKWRANLAQIWHEGLTPYRTAVSKNTSESEDEFAAQDQDWNQLTDCINASLLSRITGYTGMSNYWSLTSASCAKQDADDIPGLGVKESALYNEKDLGFLPIDLKQTWRPGATGRERTEAAQDRTWAFQNLVHEHCSNPLDIIGELQFTFAMVLTLNNNSCLEQWKRILSLLFTCKTAAIDQASLFVHFMSTLRLQIEHCQDAEGGLFDLGGDGAPLLKLLLKRFRRGLEEQTGQAKIDVMDELEDLEDFFKLEYGWAMNEPHVRSGMLRLEDGEEIDMDLSGIDEEDESGDYAPTIVGLTAEQAQELHVDSDAIRVRQPGNSVLERDVASRHAEEEGNEVDDNEEEDQDLDDMDARY